MDASSSRGHNPLLSQPSQPVSDLSLLCSTVRRRPAADGKVEVFGGDEAPSGPFEVGDLVGHGAFDLATKTQIWTGWTNTDKIYGDHLYVASETENDAVINVIDVRTGVTKKLYSEKLPKNLRFGR